MYNFISKYLDNSILNGELVPPIATSITSRPINNIPNPIKNGAILLRVSFSVE